MSSAIIFLKIRFICQTRNIVKTGMFFWYIVLVGKYSYIISHKFYYLCCSCTCSNQYKVLRVQVYECTIVYLTTFGWIIVTHNYQSNKLLSSNLKCDIFLFFIASKWNGSGPSESMINTMHSGRRASLSSS